jgi:hypothetical protein
LVLLAQLAPDRGDAAAPVVGGTNPIILENLEPGSTDWRIPHEGRTVSDDVSNQIKGYASAASVNKGGSITFYVTVNPAQPYTMDFFRMGYYQGLGGRLMLHVDPLNGIQQSSCPVLDGSTFLLSCNWTPSYSLTVPVTWTDGIYLVVLTNASGYQNYIDFVVRNDSRTAALLYQQSVNTYEAYNNWGGRSLYGYNSTEGRRAYKVSFDRPYARDGSGDFFGWEVYFVQWAEEQGYDVTYSTDVDTATNPARLLTVKGFLAVGHDEYWTKEMYDAAQTARDSGVSLGFIGGNDVFWQARYEASANGQADRVLVSYKTSDTPNSVDPITAAYPWLTTDQWRNPLPNRPEQTLMGIMYASQVGFGWDATVPYVVSNSSNRVYDSSNFVDGNSVPGIVGYEADRLWPEYPLPGYQVYSILSRSPYTNVDGAQDYSNAAIYQALSGAWVFSAGSMGWCYALARPGYLNAGIQQTTANVLNLFIDNQPVAVAATPTPAPTPRVSPLPSAYRDTLQSDLPISYWRLDETSGTTANDWENVANGNLVGDPGVGQPGALQGDPDAAMTFDGKRQYVSVPYNPALNPSTFSVEVWVEPTGGAGTYRGVMASRNYPAGWVIYATSDNLWQFWINNGTGMVTVSGGIVRLNQWTHLVATFDASTARLYVDGVLAGSAQVATYQPQSGLPLTIGQGEPGSGFYFLGSIDEPAMYGSALSPSQVHNHYVLGTQGSATSALVGDAEAGPPLRFSLMK